MLSISGCRCADPRSTASPLQVDTARTRSGCEVTAKHGSMAPQHVAKASTQARKLAHKENHTLEHEPKTTHIASTLRFRRGRSRGTTRGKRLRRIVTASIRRPLQPILHLRADGKLRALVLPRSVTPVSLACVATGRHCFLYTVSGFFDLDACSTITAGMWRRSYRNIAPNMLPATSASAQTLRPHFRIAPWSNLRVISMCRWPTFTESGRFRQNWAGVCQI